MVDLKVNRYNDLVIDPATKDLAPVRGTAEDKQRLALATKARFNEEIGSANAVNVLQRTELLASRVVNDLRGSDGVDSIAGFAATFSDTDPNTIIVRAHYISGDEFEFPANTEEDDD